jgi:hypothetical protein
MLLGYFSWKSFHLLRPTITLPISMNYEEESIITPRIKTHLGLLIRGGSKTESEYSMPERKRQYHIDA